MTDERPLLVVIGTGDRTYREYLLRSIAGPYRMHLLSGGPPTWAADYLAGWSEVDLAETVDAGEMIAATRRLAEREPVAGILTWDEARVLQCAKVAEALDLPGGDAAAAMRCRDKRLTRVALADSGIPQPRSVLADSVEAARAAADDIGYPVVLKPRAMAASLGVVRVEDAAELTARFGFARDVTIPGAWRYESVLVEQFAPGYEISVDSAVHRGVVHPLFVARKQVGYPPYFEEIGHVVDAADPLLRDPAIDKYLSDVHAAVGLTDGMSHVELKIGPYGPQLIEVNARLGGGLIPYLGALATGIEPGPVAAAVACGLPPVLITTRREVAAVRFFYVGDDDTEIGSVGFDFAAGRPAALDRADALAGAGDVLSPPPRGTAFGRVALATARATGAAECGAALDEAGTALRITPARTAESRC